MSLLSPESRSRIAEVVVAVYAPLRCSELLRQAFDIFRSREDVVPIYFALPQVDLALRGD